MNKVLERSQLTSTAKFYYSSQKMATEAKIFKVTLFVLSIIPIVLSFIPIINDVPNLTFGLTIGSFLINITAELMSSLINNHKEKSVLLHQLYEAEVSGASFSKIEYDRELTNELNELAIRKAMNGLQKKDKYYTPVVPESVSDEYIYLYMCRLNSATTKYLMSRMFYIYILTLAVMISLFVGFSFIKTDTKEFLLLIIQFYPIVLPVIRNINAANKSMKYCSKIDADIDNFFADGDDSIERLARFQYYVQNIEFEMLMANPAKYKLFPLIFKHGIKVLALGVTQRFLEAIVELKKKALMAKGITIRTPKKDILTRTEIPLEKLERKERIIMQALSEEANRHDPKSQAQDKTIVQAPVAKAPVAKSKTTTTVVKKVAPAKAPVKPATKPAAKPVAKATTAKPASKITTLKPKTTTVKAATTKAKTTTAAKAKTTTKKK